MRNNLQEPVFLDFEASGLSDYSYPIEVAWSNRDGSIESYLIKPEPDWTYWDNLAEVEIHGITREQLFDEGLPVSWVIGRMRGRLKNQAVYVDGGERDAFWCHRMFDYKGFAVKLPFRLRNYDDLLVFEFGSWTVNDHCLMLPIKMRARDEAGGIHRAAKDVKYLQALYRKVKAMAGKRESEVERLVQDNYDLLRDIGDD